MRGIAERIDAVVWFSDLRGFTRITDTAPEQAIPLLNDYSDAIVSAIHEHGGDVLKLIGDGTFAIFTAEDRTHACGAALSAAIAARERVSHFSHFRRHRRQARCAQRRTAARTATRFYPDFVAGRPSRSVAGNRKIRSDTDRRDGKGRFGAGNPGKPRSVLSDEGAAAVGVRQHAAGVEGQPKRSGMVAERVIRNDRLGDHLRLRRHPRIHVLSVIAVRPPIEVVLHRSHVIRHEVAAEFVALVYRRPQRASLAAPSPCRWDCEARRQILSPDFGCGDLKAELAGRCSAEYFASISAGSNNWRSFSKCSGPSRNACAALSFQSPTDLEVHVGSFKPG